MALEDAQIMAGKKGLVFGIANDRSIAYAITKRLAEQGAEMAFTHLPDTGDRAKNEKKVRKLVEPVEGTENSAKFIMPCDVTKDEDLDAVFERAKAEFGTIDFLLHSVAFAPPADLTKNVYECSRAGFAQGMDISAYSLIAMCGRAMPILNEGGSVLSLTYLGGEKVIPGYNIMGVCKAALESSTQYLASEMGAEKKVRVNTLSAGPLRTVSSSGVGDFAKMLKLYETFSPLRDNVTPDDVGRAGLYLLSDLSSGVTGEIHHVDCGYHVMGGPPLDAFGE